MQPSTGIGKPTFYKRPLPVPPAVEFSSPDGRKLFLDALLGGTCEGFFKLIEQFMTQDEPSFCGLASIAMVLNALAIDPRRPWRGAWRYFHDTMLDCCLPLETIKKEGTTLEQAACLARCNGAEVSFHRYGTFSVDKFRKQVEEVCRTGSSHIVVSYSRRTFLQTGDGHFSPIGAYHAEKDLVLILDVARFKYPPHWVPLPMLVEAMSFHDTTTQRPRGYMVLSPRAPIPVAFTVDISNPSRAAYSSALRFLDTYVPELHASLQASNLKDPQHVMSALLRAIPLEGADVLLAIRSKAMVQEVPNPGSCSICNPLVHHSRQQQQQQQQQPPQQQHEQLHTQHLPGHDHQQQQEQPESAAPLITGGCRGNGAYCSESGCTKAAMQRATAPSPSAPSHPHLTSTSQSVGGGANGQAGCGDSNQSQQGEEHSEQSTAGGGACSAGRCQPGSCGSSNGCGGGSGAAAPIKINGASSGAGNGGGPVNISVSSGSSCGAAPRWQEGGAADDKACASGEQDPVIQELRTTDLFKVIQDYLCTRHEESGPTPLQDYLQGKQQRMSQSQPPQDLHQIQEPQQQQQQQQQQQGGGVQGLGTDQHQQHEQQQQQQQQQQQEQAQQQQGEGVQGLGAVQQQQQQQQPHKGNLSSLCSAGSRVCTLHMVSKVAMLLWLAGLDSQKWEGLWSMGTPEKRQWWLWFGKPLETLPLLSQEVKYLRIQLQEVQKLLQLQGEQALGTASK